MILFLKQTSAQDLAGFKRLAGAARNSICLIAFNKRLLSAELL